MKNKEIKQEMLLNGSFSRIKGKDKELYLSQGLSHKGLIKADLIDEDNKYVIDNLGLKTAQEVSLITISKDIDEESNLVEAYLQLDEARKKRYQKLFKRVNFYYNLDKYDLIFATFTFDDKALNLKSDTRHQYLYRMLNKYEWIDDYILNIDYGELNEREHYHALLMIKKGVIDYKFKKYVDDKKSKLMLVIENMPIDYKMGFANYQLIGNEEKDRKKVTKYVSKLKLHARKVKQKNITFKRKSPYLFFLKNTKTCYEKKFKNI